MGSQRMTYGHQFGPIAIPAAPAVLEPIPAPADGRVPEGAKAYRLNLRAGSAAVRCTIEWGARCGPNKYRLYNISPILHPANTPFILGVSEGDTIKVVLNPLRDPAGRLTTVQGDWGYSASSMEEDRIPATELEAGDPAVPLILQVPESAQFLTLELADAAFIWHGHGVTFREPLLAGQETRVKGPLCTVTVANNVRFWRFGAQG